ncbi:hypothetical protein CRE_03325 [Caenorhabditis remanei]|uniref:DNA2/NAM7 helicase-like C-terminal domain-containing protein n=1 Tax=Caenorhabditis remanei TaxID=31234 RepID=E3MYL6_CAERE|nr:hypothetical protein CRE_03325 [Caenorhabditis remanei]
MTTGHTDLQTQPSVTMADNDEQYDEDRVIADFLEQSVEEDRIESKSLLVYKMGAIGIGGVVNKKLTMKEEIEALSVESKKTPNFFQNKKIYLDRHSLPTVPTDPQFSGALEHVTKYSAEQAHRFLAMAEVWKQREELRTPTLPQYPVEPIDDLMVDTVAGHYGLYQITRQSNVYHTATAFHKSLGRIIGRMRIESGSTILGPDGSCYLTPLRQLLLGDTIAVKEVTFVDGKACATKFCLFKRTVIENQKIHIGLNRKPVIFGTGKVGIVAEDPSLTSGTTHRADIFYPVDWKGRPNSHRNPCLSMTQPIVLNNSTDLSRKETGCHLDKNCKYTPDVLEYLVALGSSAITAARRGVWDTLHHLCTFREEDGFLKFTLRSTSSLWPPGTRIAIVGAGQAEIISTFNRLCDKNRVTWIPITAKPLGNFNFENLNDPNGKWVYQIVQRAPPILPLGFFEKMENGSNEKRIIKAFYGGLSIGVDGKDQERSGFLGRGKIVAVKFPECLQITPSDSLATYPITLDIHQSTYVSRLATGSFQYPITVGNFPILSGKTTTVAIAALEAAKTHPGTQHIIFVPDDFGAQSLVSRMESIQAKSNVRVRAVRLIDSNDPDEKTHLDYPILLKKFVQEVKDGKHNLEKIIVEKAKEYKEGDIIDDIFWLCNYFEQVRPQIIISKFQTIFSNATLFQFLDKVATIQLDNADQIPQIDLVQTCIQFPSAKYGLIGDAVKDRPSFDCMSLPQTNLAIGWLIQKSVTQKMLPIVTSNNIYGGSINPKIVALIGNLYYKDRELHYEMSQAGTVNYLENRPDIWTNPYVLFPVKILNHGFEHSEREARQLELLEKLVKKLADPPGDHPRVPMEHIGMVCFFYRHAVMLHKAFQDSGVTYGQPEVFHGIQKEILIIWGGFSSFKDTGLTMNESTFMLTRGKQAVFILGSTEEMSNMKADRNRVNWDTLVQMVKENEGVLSAEEFIEG